MLIFQGVLYQSLRDILLTTLPPNLKAMAPPFMSNAVFHISALWGLIAANLPNLNSLQLSILKRGFGVWYLQETNAERVTMRDEVSE